MEIDAAYGDKGKKGKHAKGKNGKDKGKGKHKVSLHDKYATKILLNGAARNQTNRDGVNKEEINKYGDDRQRW